MRCRTAALLLLVVTLGVGCVVTPVPLPLFDTGLGSKDTPVPTKTSDAGPDTKIDPKQEASIAPVLDMMNGDGSVKAVDAKVGDAGVGELRPGELGPGDGTLTESSAKDTTGTGEK